MNKPQALSPQPKRSDKVISSHRMKSYSMENVAMNTYLNENHKIANFIIHKYICVKITNIDFIFCPRSHKTR